MSTLVTLEAFSEAHVICHRQCAPGKQRISQSRVPHRAPETVAGRAQAPMPRRNKPAPASPRAESILQQLQEAELSVSHIDKETKARRVEATIQEHTRVPAGRGDSGEQIIPRPSCSTKLVHHTLEKSFTMLQKSRSPCSRKVVHQALESSFTTL